MKIKSTDSGSGNMNFPNDKQLSQMALNLSSWFQDNQRILPWRENRDPYRIWISEVMLQQTTVQAVIPYYDRFLLRFPHVEALANASTAEVMEMWSGLGYYSRARNLHLAAQKIAKNGFPRTAQALLELPGFGPYTSRAVSSIAFGEKVGVLDGNVIRILSRHFAIDLEWWKPAGRSILQKIADQLAADSQAEILNQGMMELGATVCTPTNPHCFRCPWNQTCMANSKQQINKFPRPKPRREPEVWIWKPQILKKGKQIALIENNYAPFLKGHWILPGSATKMKQKPKEFEGKHSITHHQIYIQKSSSREAKPKNLKWVSIQDLRRTCPSSLIQKALKITAVLSLALHFTGCASTQEDIYRGSPQPASINNRPAPIAPQEINVGTRITHQGENFRARFSEDGQALIFVSRMREQHRNSQIYEWSLTENKERRITFSDGESDFPIYLNRHGAGKALIAYASTTDSIKENIFAEGSNPQPEQDLFLYDQETAEIHKFPQVHGLFTSVEFVDSNHLLVTTNTKTQNTIWDITVKPESVRSQSSNQGQEVSYSLKNKQLDTFWLEDLQNGSRVIKIKRANGKIETHEQPFTSIHDFSWWDSDRETLLVSGKLPKDGLDSIYLFDIRLECVIPLTATSVDLWYPAVSSQKNSVAVTLLEKGKRQIYLLPLPDSLPECKAASVYKP